MKIISRLDTSHNARGFLYMFGESAGLLDTGQRDRGWAELIGGFNVPRMCRHPHQQFQQSCRPAAVSA